MCPQTEKLFQLTITQQASAIFRACITVSPYLLSNYCLDAGSTANLSPIPNLKLSCNSSCPEAIPIQSGVNLADASRK